jgi:hypothetical protein
VDARSGKQDKSRCGQGAQEGGSRDGEGGPCRNGGGQGGAQSGSAADTHNVRIGQGIAEKRLHLRTAQGQGGTGEQGRGDAGQPQTPEDAAVQCLAERHLSQTQAGSCKQDDEKGGTAQAEEISSFPVQRYCKFNN